MQVSGTQQLFDSHSVDGQRCYKSGSWGLPLTSMETSASTTLPLSIDFRTVSVPLASSVSKPALLSSFRDATCRCRIPTDSSPAPLPAEPGRCSASTNKVLRRQFAAALHFGGLPRVWALPLSRTCICIRSGVTTMMAAGGSMRQLFYPRKHVGHRGSVFLGFLYKGVLSVYCLKN